MAGDVNANVQWRYERTGKIEDLDEAISFLRTAWECTAAVPFYRIKAAAHCLRLLTSRDLDAAADLGIGIIHCIFATLQFRRHGVQSLSSCSFTHACPSGLLQLGIHKCV